LTETFVNHPILTEFFTAGHLLQLWRQKTKAFGQFFTRQTVGGAALYVVALQRGTAEQVIDRGAVAKY
jgi:hypothetical protein